MATEKKCDRCGTIYNDVSSNDFLNNNVVIVTYYDDYEEHHKAQAYDLCPDCMENIECFLWKR